MTLMATEEDVLDEYTKHAIEYYRTTDNIAAEAAKSVKASDIAFYAAVAAVTKPITLTARSAVRKLATALYKAEGKEAITESREIINDLSEIEASFQQEALEQQLAAINSEDVVTGVAGSIIAGMTLKETLSSRRIDAWIESLFANQAKQASELLFERMIQEGRGAKSAARDLMDEIINNGVTRLNINRNNAQAIVRGYSSKVANNAREALKNANKDILEYELWTSTLDQRTTSTCRIRSGKKYTLEGKPINHSIPYKDGPGEIHWGCRSVGVLSVKGKSIDGAQPEAGVGEDYEYSGINAARSGKTRTGKVRTPTRATSTPHKDDIYYKNNPDKFADRTEGDKKIYNARTAEQKEASLGAQKASKDTYNSFLRRQYNKGANGQAFVADTLGPTRAKLFGEGKLDIKNFHIDNLDIARDVAKSRGIKLSEAKNLVGEQFTVRELRKRHPNIWSNTIGKDNSHTTFKAAK